MQNGEEKKSGRAAHKASKGKTQKKQVGTQGADSATYKKKKSHGLQITIAIVLLLGVAAGGYYAYGEITNYLHIAQMKEVVEIDTFYSGITIDGRDVSGMTILEAREMWGQEEDDVRGAFGLTLTMQEQTYKISQEDAQLSFNHADIIEEAFALGRIGELADRYEEVLRIAQEGAQFETKMDMNTQNVVKKIEDIAASLYIAPVDATVTSFNQDSKTFSFTQESAGRQVDAAPLVRQAVSLLENGEYGKIIPIVPEEIAPTVYREALSQNFGLISSYSTTTTSDSQRNNNIRLSSEAISGTVVEPGNEFSFNALTGERTTSKGYQDAGAIKNGIMIKEPGGGVCQTSTTIFNAVARADLELVERNPHSWPSSYVKIGMDAAVNWPGADFRFKNNKSTPVAVICWYENKKIYCEIYGELLPDGMTIGLESTNNGSIAPKAPQIIRNNALAAGSKLTIREARTGHRSTTYIVYYDKDDKEISRKVLFESYYPPLQAIFEVGPEPKPTAPPPPPATPEPG